MIRLFIAPDQCVNGVARIMGPDHLHLARVLRAQPGQSIMLLDNLGNGFHAVLVTVEKSETTARIESTKSLLASEPPLWIGVAQSLGKGDKFDQVIQHGTEIGACTFIPIKAERSVVDPTRKVTERVARWQQIAKGAAEQSGRALIPQVLEPVSLASLLSVAAPDDLIFLLHPSAEAQPLSAALAACDLRRERGGLLLAIGPEGGWSPAELAIQSAVKPMLVTLGPRILRTETAALVAISQILYHIEQL